MDIPNERKLQGEINEQFRDRWSPRAFSSQPLSESEISSLFEAARWAPSCYNEQPWFFVFASKEEELEKMRTVLLDGNRRWADRAPFLALLFAKKTFAQGGKKNKWAAFDCGAAWMSLALQARHLGLYAHAMAGFSAERAYEVLSVDKEKYRAMAAIAVGHYGDPTGLPEDLQGQEKPNERKALAEVAKAGPSS
mgnify:CR=1 FL=1